jgi:predicted DNA-binding transcriptional regulator YafY
MAYSKSNLETHSLIVELYHKYRDREFIQFRRVPPVKGTQYLEKIIRSIEQRQVLRIYYHPYYEDKPYFNEVHPYLLKEHGLRWYLVGLNDYKGELRTYALDRIRDLEEEASMMYKEPEFDVSDYFKYAIGIIAPQGVPPLIKIAVQKTQAQYLISQPWHESQNIVGENDQEVVFSFRVHPTYEFKSLVLALGKDGKVLAPDHLINEIRLELKAMQDQYR